MKDDTQLARWLSDEMEASELEALKHSPEYPTLVKIRENFNQLESPKFNAERILQEVLSHEKTIKKAVPIYQKRWFQMAALFVVLLGIAIIFADPKRQYVSENETLPFTLPDESEVILNTESKAIYSKWNWAKNREIFLEGEAYFKVEKGATFLVKTALGTVTVVGTEFNVSVRDNQFEVICYEGKVRVEKDSKQILLLPKQQITFAAESNAEMEYTTESAPGWLYPEMRFAQEEFTTVIKKIEKQYDVKINATLHTRQLFSGSLPSNDLDSALKMLCSTFHLEFVKSADHIKLVPIDANP